MVGNMRKRKKGKKKNTKEKTEAFAMAMKNVLKQPEKNAQRDPGEKGWAYYYCRKEGHHKRDCPQASKPPLAPCPVCKGPHWRRDCPPRCRPKRSGSQDYQDQRCPGIPTQAPILIIPEEPRGFNNCGGSISPIFFWTLGQPSLCSLKPLAHFPPDPLP